MKTLTQIFLVAGLVVSCTACQLWREWRELTTVQEPLDSQSSIIGISGENHSLTSQVYFIKVDNEENLYNQRYVITSNCARAGQVYLLNVKPGRYAAVAYSFTGSPVGRIVILFPKKVIKLTEVQVAPGTIEFMGDYFVPYSLALWKKWDDAQSYYVQLIPPPFGEARKGVLRKAKRDKQAEIKFLTNALEHFKDTHWIDIIQKRMEDLKAEK